MKFWLVFSICVSFLLCFSSDQVDLFFTAPNDIILQIINDSVPENKADTCLNVAKKMALVSTIL